MSKRSTIHRVLNHIAAFRRSSGQRLLDVCYGPQAMPLRTQVLSMMFDRKFTGSDKQCQWGNFRKIMLQVLAVETGISCIAEEDSQFEQRADGIIGGAA